MTSSLQPTDVHLIKFIAHLSLKGFKHLTDKSYIFAISYFCKLYHNSDPTKTFIVHKLLQGMKRSNPSTDTRPPITLDILNILLPKLQIICKNMYEAALCFYLVDLKDIVV